MFRRRCFLVVDREFAGSISTRKLVLETAKFNVITAYNFDEAVETLERFPNVDGVVVTADRTLDPDDFLKLVRDRHPGIKRVMTGEGVGGERLADRRVGSFEPAKLLEVLRDLFPEDSASVLQTEQKLEAAAANGE